MKSKKLKALSLIFTILGAGCNLASGVVDSRLSDIAVREETRKTVVEVMNNEKFRQKLIEQMAKKDS